MTAILVIPYRDRGIDPYRPLNLKYVTNWWADRIHLPVIVTGDGRAGQEPFNRSACYNQAVDLHPNVDVFVFAESDVFCDPDQIHSAIDIATQAPGLVVGFSRFMEINEADSIRVREGQPHDTVPATQIRGDKGSNGAINVISRDTYNLVGGYDETFSSAWWDDTAMGRAFDICCGPTRYVDGQVFHLFHASGGRAGAVTTEADRAATEANRRRYEQYLQATTPEQIRVLTGGE
jgi:hypothetical protein